MALRAIRINNDPILKRPCREVPQVDDRVRQLLDDMLETLHATANGAAIAAPQVGILRRLIVIDMGELSGGPLKLVNPRIIFQEGQQECEEEGCLSFPDCWLTTLRPQRVIVEAMNEEGKTILLTGSGPLAQCFSHEIDHLDGVTFQQCAIDRPQGRAKSRRRIMEWIQLLLPQEGMREALLRCLTGCSLDGCHLDREAIEQDFSGWLQQRRDEALGLSCVQRWLYLAVTPEDEVIGSAAVAAGEGGFVRSIWLHPDCDQLAYREQIEQQLTDMGF